MTPQHYPVAAGRLYAGEYPGSWEPEVAVLRLRALLALGIRTFVDLTAPADLMTPYAGLLPQLEAEAGGPLRHVSIPIPDMGVPAAPEVMARVLRTIEDGIHEGAAVYVHCWGGIGRTGTAVGCWLRQCGSDGPAALARVQELYSRHMAKARNSPEAPQTPEQKAYVMRWRAL